MKRTSFLGVIFSNIKCGLCKKKNCKVRYLPERKRYTYAGGTRYVTYCEKDWDKRMNKVFNRKLL